MTERVSDRAIDRLTFGKGVQKVIKEVAEHNLAVRVPHRLVPLVLGLKETALRSVLSGRHVAIVCEYPVAFRQEEAQRTLTIKSR